MRLRLVVSAVALVLALGGAAAAGALVDLGTLGGASSFSYGINNSGEVAGVSQTADAVQHGFVWSNGSMADIGIPGDPDSTARSISDTGYAAGYFVTAYGDLHAFLSKGGVTLDLGDQGAGYSMGYGVNDAGEVAGVALDSMYCSHAFKFSSQGFVVLPDLGFPGSQAFAINNSGTCAGWASGSDGSPRAVCWSDEGIESLGIVGIATALNDAGWVTGVQYSQSGWQAFLRKDGVNTFLPSLGGSYSYAYDVNVLGQAVGQSTSSVYGTRACLWDDGACIDLNTLLPPGSGWTLMEATGINDFGDITGWGMRGSDARGFLMIVERTIPVAIDIKPEDRSNRIVLKDSGIVKAAILARPAGTRTEYFDVHEVDISTVKLAGASVKAMPDGYQYEITDVDADGHSDLLLFFRMSDLELTTSNKTAVLTGKTNGGTDIEGSDVVSCSVKKNGK